MEKTQIFKKEIEKLFRMSKGNKVIFIAVNKLKTQGKIKFFFGRYLKECKKWKKEGVKGLEDAEKVAIENIGYVINYYSDEVIKKWRNALPQLDRPFILHAMT